jgi:hypothetical protein
MTIAANGARTSKVKTIEVKPTGRIPRVFNQVITLNIAVPINKRSSGNMSSRK